MLRVALSPLILGGAFAYGQVVGWDSDAKVVLYLAAAATIFVQIAEPLQAGFQAIERMEYLAYSDIISKSGQGLVGIVVVLLGFGTVGITACWAAMTGLRRACSISLAARAHPDRRCERASGGWLAVARASVPYWAFGLFFMVYLWIDFVMLSLLTTAEVVGWYGVPMQALPDADVSAGRGRDRVAAALRSRVRTGRREVARRRLDSRSNSCSCSACRSQR